MHSRVSYNVQTILHSAAAFGSICCQFSSIFVVSVVPFALVCVCVFVEVFFPIFNLPYVNAGLGMIEPLRNSLQKR